MGDARESEETRSMWVRGRAGRRWVASDKCRAGSRGRGGREPHTFNGSRDQGRTIRAHRPGDRQWATGSMGRAGWRRRRCARPGVSIESRKGEDSGEKGRSVPCVHAKAVRPRRGE